MALSLVVFDLDGTLLRGATVCEVLADRFDRSDEMAAFEALTDIADIRAARETMFDWYGDVPIPVLCSYLDALRLAPGAEEACARLRDAGVTLAVASFTWEFAVETVARRLGIPHWIGTRADAEGRFEHVWHDTKAEWVLDLTASLGLTREGTAAVGDSGFDVPMLHAVGTAVYVGAELVDGLPTTTIHIPHADLRDVAEVLLTTSTSRTGRDRYCPPCRFERG